MKHSFRRSQIAAFRLGRHHLADQSQEDLTTVCRNVCGIQAQVMGAAQMQLWARAHHLTREAIDAALWSSRTLVKMYAMRGTLHLVTAADFPVYIAALKTSRLRQWLSIMARYGVSEKEAWQVRDAAMETLRPGPVARREITEQVLSKAKVGKKAQFFMRNAWVGALRLAFTEGLVCYGPDCGKEVAMIRVDQWLPKLKKLSEAEAQRTMLRRYLGTYGPATVRDFAKWSGMAMPEAKAVVELLKDEWLEVDVEGKSAMILRKDLEQLNHSSMARPVVRLLPNFDPYLLAHAEKDHLVEPAHYKRVYRNQGWISPVVLLDGRVAGTWSSIRRGKRSVLEIKPFETFSKIVRTRIEDEAESLGRFLETSWEIKFGNQ